jgi:hypothetical protein
MDAECSLPCSQVHSLSPPRLTPFQDLGIQPTDKNPFSIRTTSMPTFHLPLKLPPGLIPSGIRLQIWMHVKFFFQIFLLSSRIRKCNTQRGLNVICLMSFWHTSSPPFYRLLNLRCLRRYVFIHSVRSSHLSCLYSYCKGNRYFQSFTETKVLLKNGLFWDVTP